MFYYAVNNTDFEVNSERIEGTYQKYASLDDKTDGFFYYTRYIKFGVGRAMLDSAQEIRNGHINKDEGKRLESLRSKMSIAATNRRGERGHPCRTPLLNLKIFNT